MHKRHIILLAHGSRNEHWQTHLESGVDQLSHKLDAQQLGISLAHMELASPTLHEEVLRNRALGAEHFYIYPLFFASGKHLQEDVPAQLARIQQDVTDCTFELGNALAEQDIFWQFIESAVLDFAS